MRLLTFCIMVGGLTLASPSAALAKTTWKAKVGGKTFRITLDDGVVNVVDKSLLTGRNMEVRDMMRAAVIQATGCEIIDEMWFDAKMKGRFKCPDGTGPRSPVGS